MTQQFPLLLIPSSSSTTTTEEKRSVYSVSQRKIYDLGIELPYSTECRGSSYGWLVTVEKDKDLSVRLFNPFLSVNNQIQLPPLRTSFDQFVDDPVRDGTFLKKAILSKDPLSSSSSPPNSEHNENNDLLVVAIFGETYSLAFCKPGDESWTCLPIYHDQLLTRLADVTYYKGMLYTVGWRGDVVAFDIHAFITSKSNCKAHPHDQYYHLIKPKVVATPPLKRLHEGFAKYILESSGNLLEVQRFYKRDGHSSRKTIKFQVFKLLLNEEDDEEKYSKWEEVKNLQGHSLFLGDNGSMSLSVVVLAECSGYKPNCIYFTDDCLFERGADDSGVFNLEDGSFQQHYTPDTSIWPQPIWVQPTQQQRSKI